MYAIMLKPMFANVAETYDLANKVLTFGLDKRWRKACVQKSQSGRLVVDLCCGTGDLTFSILPNLNSESFLVGIDFSKEMLSKAVAKNRKRRKNQRKTQSGYRGAANSNVAFVIADAAHLPLKSECIDDMRISFSFRNLIYKNPKAVIYLKEATRTLKRNGRFACVETSQPKSRIIRDFFHFYCLKIVPSVGEIVSGQRAAYNYLGKSAANFPFPKDILTMFKKAGFTKAGFKPLSFGIVGLYTATK